MGLGAKEGIDAQCEATGRVPDAQWKASYYANSSLDDRAWKGGGHQPRHRAGGPVGDAAPDIAASMQGISTKGTIWKPHLLKSSMLLWDPGSVIDHRTRSRTRSRRPAYLDGHAGLKGVIYGEGADVPLRHASRDGGRQGQLSPDAQEPARRLVHRLCASDDP